MPLSHLIPRRVRGTDEDDSREPSWLNKKVTSLLLSASYHVCIHPIYTVVIVALLASTTYIGLLEGSLVDSIRDTVPGQIDIESLLQGGRHLRLGPATEWKWRAQESVKLLDTSAQHLALTTFIFPDSNSQPKHTAPSPNKIHFGENITLQSIPETPHLLSPISSESSLAFVVPYIQLPGFLKTAQEIPQSFDSEDSGEQKKWIMKAARSPTYGNRKAVRIWLSDAWTSFVDLIKHAETVDIIIMSLGYIAMHLTFVSLFISMRRLGSHFWLATTVLFTGGIAFLFGLLVTTKLGVPMSMVLLSEGLPFLVVTVGFEKAIILTEAVLSAFNRQHASDRPRTSDGKPMNPIQGAIQTAIKEKGFLIVRDYCIEIAIISVGGVSGVQGGLRQFCCLAAWILFFDAVLLFMFYTTILCIKLEISCIKRHVALRKALEEEGINYRVAEHVASSNDWPRTNDEASSEAKKDTIGIFDKAKASSVPRFKFFMVAGFIIVNIIHLLTIRFKKHEGLLSPLFLKFFSTSINPFKVAENGLDTIYVSAKSKQVETFVTVLPPIKYSLEYPSVHYANSHVFDIEYSDQILDVVGGKVFESLLKSLEDPVISKWIVAALMLSVGLNGYLFNAARWSLKEPDTVTTELPSKIEPAQEKEDEAIKFKRKEVAQSINLRSREECERLVKEKMAPYLQDEELIDLAVRGKIPGYALEKNMEQPEVDRVEAFTRAVKIRRAMIARNPLTSETTGSLENSKVPYMGYNYSLVHGACCENVIGYLPLPLGLAGPLNIDGKNYFIPMATTEGVLVASTSRGCKAINAGGGAVTVVIGDGMTRGPCVSFPTLSRAGAAKLWLDSEEGRTVMKNAFNSTSRFARLQQMKASLAGTYLYIRFKTTTGDAMGMNMISKGVERALHAMATEAGFEDMVTITVSGNFCVDKKPAAINWIDGRGKSVIAEATVPAAIVKSVLKTDVDSLVELNISKNLVGSAMAGSVGGFNAHASNIVTAVFLATGQDPAQNIESSNCITLMKNVNGNLHITVSMPSVEVGTIGGGTILEAQSGMLDLLGIRGAHPTNPGSNARQLARTVAAAVLAGELSLCSALAAGHLVRAHMAHNRSQVPSRAATPASMPPASPSSVPKELVNAQKNGVNGGSTVGISIAGAVDRLSLPSARR